MSTSTHQPQASSKQPVHGRSPRTPQPHQTADLVQGTGLTSIALRALEGEGEAEYVPLGALRLDERNVRKDPPTEEEIDELADLIDAQGLLQNLTVVAYSPSLHVAGEGKGRAKGLKQVYTHGVIAGGRRYRALMRLVQRERITLDEQILCTKVNAERAVAVSAAENSGRKAMSTADTLVAFADMVRAGAGIEELAVCFGLSPLTVQRRFKLANVSPALFDLFRQEAMTLDQLMALALTEDHAAQEAAWKAAPAHNRSPRALRALIAGDDLSLKVIKFVGLKAYQSAGGLVLQDLFAEDKEQAQYIQDPALMMRLANEKLDAICKKATDQGAAWSQAFTNFGYSEREQFIDVPMTLRVASEEEAMALQTLEQAREQVQAEITALYDLDAEEDQEVSVDQISQLEARERELAAEQEVLLAARREVLPEISALVGTVVFLDEKGKAVKVNKVRKDDMVAARRAMSKAKSAQARQTGAELGQGAQSAHSGQEEPMALALSERLCRQLTSHRTRAMQALMLGQQRVALAALLHPLLSSLIYGVSGQYESPSPLNVRANDVDAQLHSHAPDMGGSPAEAVVLQAVEQVRQQLPKQAKELQSYLLALDLPALVDLLTLASALSLDAISGNATPHCSGALAKALQLDMRQWWLATGPAYLANVPKSLISAALAEAGMPDEALAISKLKKAEAVSKAEVLLQGKAWVPAILRH